MKLYVNLLVLCLVILISGCSDKKSEIKSLEMLKGGKVFAVPTGTVADQFVLKRFPDAKFKYFNTVLDCAVAVNEGKADAAIYDKPILQNIAAKIEGLVVLSELLEDDKYGFAVQLDNVELKKTMDEVLAEIKANGTYDEMLIRWFPEKGEPAPMPLIQLEGTNGTLRFGTAAVTEPMSFMNAERKVVGFDVEFASYIAQKLGKKLEILDMEFGAMLPALISGKVDLVGAGLSITKERAKSVLFSESYYPSGIAVMVKNTKTEVKVPESGQLKTLDDLKNKRIGALLGSIQDMYVTKNYPDADICQFQNISDLLLALNGDKVDVILIDDISFGEIAKTNKSLVRFYENVFFADIAAGLNQENDELTSQFNAFLKEIRSNGIYDDMVSRWIDEGIREMPEIKGSDSNGTLKVGVVSDSGMPFTGLVNGEMSGFDIELSKRFATYIGKTFVPIDIPFGSMLASVSTKKIDIILCCLMITDERKKQIDFSDPYYKSGASFVAKKVNVNKPSSDKMAVLKDIADKKVGISSGTVHDKYLAENYPEAKVLMYDNSSDMLLSLKTGKIDAIMIDALTSNLILKKNPELAILDSNFFSMPLGVGFNKSSISLRNEFNIFLKLIRANGTYGEMTNRWFVNDAEEAKMPEFVNNASGKKLTAAVSVADLPYVSYMDGQYVGFDIEMIQRFAEWGKYNLEIIQVDFPSLIAALISKKADIITDAIGISEERARQIDFSDAYAYFQSAVVIEKKNLAGNTVSESTPVKKSFIKSISNSFYSNIILEKRYLLILDGLKVTVLISILAAIIGTIIGAMICWMRMAKQKAVSLTAKLFINLVRGTPVLVLLMIIFYVIFASVNINPIIVAVIAFGINFGAYVSEMFRTSVESVDKGQREAGIAAGFTKTQTFMYIIMPQALRQVLPVYKGEFISLLKMTSIVGYIAVQDLTKASDIIRSRTFDAFFPLIMAAVMYILIAWVLTSALNYVEISVDPKRKHIKKIEEAGL